MSLVKKNAGECVNQNLVGRLPGGVAGSGYAPDRVAREIVSLLLSPKAVTEVSKIRPLVKPPVVGSPTRKGLVEFLLSILVSAKAMYRGHFELLSGRHSEWFLIFNRVGSLPVAETAIIDELAGRLASARPDLVIGPVSAGGLLVQDLADALGATPAFFDLDSTSRPMAIRSGYEVPAGSRAVIVNDLATTGTGLEYMRRILASYGAELVGIGLFATRGHMAIQYLSDLASQWRIPIETLIHLDIESVEVSECEACDVGKAVPQQSCMFNC